MSYPFMPIRPRSVLRLVLYGFSLVSLPLMFAVAYALTSVDRLVDQGQNTVYQAARVVQSSLLVRKQITDMERNARQFMVLGDPELLQAYNQNREPFLQSVAMLRSMPLEPDLKAMVEQMAERELEIYTRLRSGNTPAAASEDIAAHFGGLLDMSQRLMQGGNELIDKEVRIMQEGAAHTQQMLFWLASALIPLAMISAVVFTILISRPVRAVERAIRRLGDGVFHEPIEVRGPRDLETLGQRLDWLRQRLIDLENQKTRFLRHVSHELKTPLTAIRESGQLLSDGVAGPLAAPQREIVRILHANSVQLQRLIEDLLNFSTTQTDTLVLYSTEVDMRALIESVVQNHKPALMSQRLELDCRLERVSLIGDEAKLRAVVDNLIGNAIKFSPVGGVIVVELRRSGDLAVIDVIDDGPGIPSEQAERVFDAFFQGEQKGSSYVEGSGLGLSIAREYVRAHGGRIAVVDNAESGAGAHLQVSLPLEEGRRAIT